MCKNFTIEEAESIGKQFRAKRDLNWGYESSLTIGKEYLIIIDHRILTYSPLCVYKGDDGEMHRAHLERFTKIEEVDK